MRFAAVATFAFALLAVASPAQEPTKNELLLAIEKQLKSAHEIAGPCVGCVVVSRSDQYPKPATAVPGKLGDFDPKKFLSENPQAKPELALALNLADTKNIPDHGFACGVVIDAKGLVLTPYHVIDGATKIYVHLNGGVGSYADVFAADARNDLAVLSLIAPPPGMKAIKFADVTLDNRGSEKATVSGGKLVVLMSNTYATNVERRTLSSAALGSIANVYPRINLPNNDNRRSLDSYYYHGPLIAHDAKLHAGISGAALLNLDSELIGLTTTAPVLGLGEKSPDFAFPMDENLRRVIDVLRRGEEVEYGFLGVSLNTELREVFVRDVIPLGPAAQAGVAAGDTITHINGVPVNTYPELLNHIGSALAGTKVKVTLAGRNNKDVVVTLGKLRHEQPLIASVRPEPVFGLRVDHESVLAQLVGTNTQILTRGVPPGVSVREVAANSPAATAFKKLGDQPERWLIIRVNGNAVSSPAEFYKAAKGQKAIKLVVIDPTESNRTERELSFP